MQKYRNVTEVSKVVIANTKWRSLISADQLHSSRNPAYSLLADAKLVWAIEEGDWPSLTNDPMIEQKTCTVKRLLVFLDVCVS